MKSYIKMAQSVSREGNPQGIIRDVAPDETIVIDQIFQEPSSR